MFMQIPTSDPAATPAPALAPQQRLTDRGALVVGAAGALRQAVVRRLSAEGALVSAHLPPDAAGTGAERIDEALPLSADLRDPDECRRIVADATSVAGGRLDALVFTGALTAAGGSLDALTVDTWRAAMGETLRACFLVCQAAAAPLSGSDAGAVVVVAPSGGASGAGRAASDAAAAGLVSLARALAVELGPAGVRANAVCPGALDSDDAAAHELVADQPIARPGRADEVAAAVAFLASPDARYVTGQALLVDGGRASMLATAQEVPR